ncbi:hypothetical protein BCEP4_1420003 [Burkholderia cepacia]|nr:hypothetical protein BCEP4_1420003 [Burkholderia cepacia]
MGAFPCRTRQGRFTDRIYVPLYPLRRTRRLPGLRLMAWLTASRGDRRFYRHETEESS